MISWHSGGISCVTREISLEISGRPFPSAASSKLVNSQVSELKLVRPERASGGKSAGAKTPGSRDGSRGHGGGAMSGWTDRVDFPDLGPGWVRLSKARPVDQMSGRHVDHIYVAPSGAKFRSLKQAMEYNANAPAFEAKEPAKVDERKPRKRGAMPSKAAKAKDPAAAARAEKAREALSLIHI